MDSTFYGFIPIIVYYLGGIVAYITFICLWNKNKKDEGYTYINNTIRLEEL